MSEQNTGGQPSDADYWYALGVKDGRDGCLVEMKSLQARCDKLEAALRRLASSEAFTVPRATNPEERARMEYAERAPHQQEQ